MITMYLFMSCVFCSDLKYNSDTLGFFQNELERNITVLKEKEEELDKAISRLSDKEEIDVDEAVTTTAPLYKQSVSFLF